MGDRFWAGLWENQDMVALVSSFWDAQLPDVAPTWSWLSVQFPVSRMAGIQDVEIRGPVQPEDMHYISSGPVYLEGALEAEITLRLPLTKATIEKRDSDSGHMRSSINLPHFAGNTVFGLKEDYLLHLPGEHHISSSTKVFFAPLWITRAPGFLGQDEIAGIIMRRRQGSSVYERIRSLILRYYQAHDMGKSLGLYAGKSIEEINRLVYIGSFFSNVPLSSVRII